MIHTTPLAHGARTRFALLLVLTLPLLASCNQESTPAVSAVTCAAGELGCACASGGACGTTPAGESMRCLDDICAPASCEPGDTGCVCRAGTRCTGAADACTAGVCKAVGCVAGTLSCDCLLGTCGAGLYCDATFGGGTCVDDAGFPGGECLANGLCHNRSRCDNGTSTCVHCELGSQGCAPDAGICNTGLVYAVGRCLPRNEVPPGSPECYTRCTGDVQSTNGTLTCDSEGFLAGCLPGLECTEGTCLPAGEARASCDGDSQCPDHQTCLADHRCYSNCDTNAECPSGLACHLHVCRMPCEATPSAEHACPDGTGCDMEDGQNGFCMPRAAGATTAADSPEVSATFAVSPNNFSLTLLEPSADVTLSNHSSNAEHFTIRKSWHRAFNRQGVEVVDARAETEPLWFVTLASAGSTRLPGGALDVTAAANCGASCPKLNVSRTSAIPSSWSRYEGSIEIRHATMGAQTVTFSYQAAVDGRWTGTMYYFASFPDVLLDEWRDGDRSQSNEVGNGLIAQWAAYRSGRLNTFDQMQAVLTATATESWRWPSVMNARASCSGVGACYLFDSGGTHPGAHQYVDNLVATPLPTGATQYPIALNLRTGPLNALGQYTLTGAIDSSVALHYGGNPRVDLAFFTRPDDVTRCESDLVPGDCVSYLADFRSDVVVGARRPTSSATCGSPDLQYKRTPWLVPGFTTNTRGGYREECRETAVPFTAADPRNANLTVGNPVADGHSLRRQLRLTDGAMIDQEHLFIFFEESVTSSLRAEPVKTHGYMLLERSAQPVTDLEVASQTVGTSARAVTVPEPAGSATCDAALALARARLPAGMSIAASISDEDRASLMLTGRLPGPNQTPVSGVHYLCVDSGLIDGGPLNKGLASDVLVPCPSGSNVRYFILPAPFTQATVAALPCQQDRTCAAQVQSWLTSDLAVQRDPTWSCSDGSASCSAYRFDLRVGKTFYAPGPNVFLPLESAVADAFRYRTRFQSTQDRSVGFAPVPCVGSGDLTPYCYDAGDVEETRARVDCLLATYAAHVADRTEERWLPLRTFLSTSLSAHPTSVSPNAPPGEDGFERFHAELVIMLGDDALTHALGSRFDLAATNGASFFGSEFESNGINVAGIAGYEMRELHKAVQYYEMATERFFTHVAPVVFAAIAANDVGPSNVASPALVSTYLERLIGGSTKKAAAWSYIADRYRGFNRPDLARSVMQRAYMGTYLESMLLSRLMLDIAANTDVQNRDAIVTILERAQSQYGTALARMREVYNTITQDGERFGFSPDYIPFPAVDDADTRFSNAFESVLGLARIRADTARRFEDDAVISSRTFEADAASFQSELVQISVDKERRLADICGSFTGSDQRVHPAITRYAYLSDTTALMGDPCGFVGTGEIHARTADIGLLQSDVTEYRRRIDALKGRIAREQTRVDAQCSRLGELGRLQIGEMERRRSIQTMIDGLEYGVSLAQRVAGHVGVGAGLATCGFFDCPAVPGKVAAYATAAAASELAIIGLQAGIITQRQELADSQMNDVRNQIDSECASIQIDSLPVVADIAESMVQLNHDISQTILRVRMDLDGVTGLRLEARRLEQEQHDAEQLAIDVQASRNDPNVRVYMNTAMINADRSFNRALEHAFRATRLLEYFKSESYVHADELYLIRMVSRGEYNLDSYLDALEDDYEAFRVQYRTRSKRAVRLSMADDIMMIPLIDAQGRALTSEQRTALMRERLLDPTRLDANGRRTFEFRTTLDQFAPCTFGHQIDYIEVMFSGSNLGDANSSVMVWQDGTGIVERADQGQNFHRLPPALIVATPRRDLDMAFEPSVYRNYGMRERPLVNTSWRLVFDEFHPQNRDVRFDRMNDIFIYIYYTDFTNPNACR